MKKVVSLILCILASFSLLFSSHAFAQNGQIQSYKATVEGRNGDVTVQVDLNSEKIINVSVLEHQESEGIADLPLERIPKQIVEHQSLMVDAVGGATMTSQAIVEGAKKALSDGGVDIAVFMVPIAAGSASTEPIVKETDIVIVGAGGAGLSAAVSATQNGAKVIVVEKMPKIGGNTLISGSAFNAVAPDRQKAQGIEDSTDLHFSQTIKGGDNLGDPELVRTLVDNAYSTLKWLEDDLHIEFKKDIIQVVGALHQRGFEPVKPLGTGYINGYKQFLDSHNVEILLDTRIDTIILKDGVAVGVSGKTSAGQLVTVNANKGVIIAAGGFGANIEMREEVNTIWPSLKNQPTTNHPGATGDGMIIAKAAGAQLIQMEQIQLHPMGDPVTGSLDTNPLSGSVKNTIFVNNKGERYVAEDARRDTLSKAALQQPEGMFWAIMDTNTYPNEDQHKSNFNKTMGELIASGHAVKADSVEELAKKMNVSPEVLVQTVKDFNEAVAEKSDLFERKLFDQPIAKPPFYAGLRKPTVHHTMGGIKINKDAQVIDAHGQPIPHLYAAGEVTGGIHGANRLGGNALADINVFGKIAGKNAAEN